MNKDLLVELGTEELPPKALEGLIDSFQWGVKKRLEEAELSFTAVEAFATPRRLALIVRQLAERQPDRTVEQKGPPVRIAFDDSGQATKAAEAFASKCGVSVDELDRTSTDKGEWLSYTVTEQGQPMSALIAGILEASLLAMPIPRRMRWGDSSIEFVRPVHWLVLLYGGDVLPATLLGTESGRDSRGHRFHSPGPVSIADADDYEVALEKAHVIADMSRRYDRVVEGVNALADQLNGSVEADDELFHEVNALVEWPVPIVGTFEERFLDLPKEVVTSTLTGHQRYFPVVDGDGGLLPKFITVANLDSKSPELVVDGNERVIRPRLADAAFFWETDRATPLAERRDSLARVVYQQGLGSLADKAARVGILAAGMAEALGEDSAALRRAAELAKCDLVTGMVGEFPELQGTMGRYYALADGEQPSVANAVEEHYLPRFAGDALPASREGRLLAVADRLDTLAGIFVLGKTPSGNRDPFGLRRAALGVVRILVECELPIDLAAQVGEAVRLQRDAADDAIAEDVLGFIQERLRGYVHDRGTPVEQFEAVAAVGPATLPDFMQRLSAVAAFSQLPESESLAAANKRTGNILKKSAAEGTGEVDTALLVEDAERELYSELGRAELAVQPLLKQGRYTESLQALAALKQPVDRFFDDVMVMAEDEHVRRNRLALLARLQSLFSGVADLSRLSLQ